MLENWQPRGIILTDLDDTLVVSEDGHMLRGWNRVLRPWERAWKPDGERTTGLTMVKEDERPGVGVKPREVIRHFIQLYGLRPDQVDKESLELSDFIHKKELLALRDGWDDLTPKEQEEALIEVLEAERVASAYQIIADEGVETTPRAREMIEEWHNAGMGVGIVTQAPFPLASLMLGAAGLKEVDPVGNVKKRYYDVVVSAGMAGGRHKPDPYHLQMAAIVIHWNDLILGAVPGLSKENKHRILEERREIWQRRSQGAESRGGFKEQLYQKVRSQTVSEYPPEVYCGDSGSDAGAVSGWRQQEGIRLPIVFRIHKYTNKERLIEMVNGVGFTFVDDLSVITQRWIEQQKQPGGLFR